MFRYIYRGSWHINTKLAAQTLSYKMKNICPRQRRENYFKTLKLLQISIGKLCRFTEALVRLAEKDIKPARL